MTRSTKATKIKRTRRSVALGVVYLVLAAVILLVLPRGTAGLESTFDLSSQRGGVDIAGPEVPVSTATALYVLGVLLALAGTWQLAAGDRFFNGVLLAAVTVAITAFLVWATRDAYLNLTGMLVSSLVRATPIALAALSGIWSERSGVVNIGIEGMMLGGAFTSVVVASISDNMLLGVLAGMLTGLLLALLHAVLSIRFRVDQIISGTGIIILMLGLTSYLQRAVLNVNRELNAPGPAIAALPIPGLWRIPVLGPLLFRQSPIIYAMIVLLVATHVVMNYTRWGLRIRSVGEHPRAADTLGINVFRTRYVSVLVSGAVAGLAGAYISVGVAGRFNEGITAGKGFLGLAAMIFGNWNPGGAFLGSLIFGFFDSWQEKLALLQVGVAGEILGMTPYLATMIALAGLVGRARVPAADGQTYEKQ
jgi:simple sugar transport system permease protein